MITTSPLLFEWPAMPQLPPPGQVVLLRVPANLMRSERIQSLAPFPTSSREARHTAAPQGQEHSSPGSGHIAAATRGKVEEYILPPPMRSKRMGGGKGGGAPSTSQMQNPQMPNRLHARQELRSVLRQILSSWNGLPVEQLPLQETLRGPQPPGQLLGHTLDISLAYAENEGWIGLVRGGLIGMDVMPLKAIPEAEEVADLYLGPAAAAILRHAPDPVTSFAVAWTQLEARLKCLKRGLAEWSPASAAALAQCSCQHLVFANRLAVAVATA